MEQHQWSLFVMGALLSVSGAGRSAHAAAAETGGALDEIIVTSRRVVERLQDTPIAVSAFQASDIEKLSIRNIGDAASFTPNFLSNPGPTGGSDAFFFIRGVGQTDLNPATDPGVATYIDGVYLGRVMGASMDASDVSRIEVLRGPQGTLFGRNTIGGAVSITTRDPGKEFAADIGVSGGSRSLKQVRGSLDIPLTPSLGLLVSANYRDQDGWGRRADGTIFDTNTTKSGRIKLKWDPSDTFSLVLSGDITKLTGTPQHTILVGLNPAAFSPLGVPLPQGMGQYLNPSDPYVNSSSRAPTKAYDVKGAGLSVAWKLGWAELKSISAYRKLTQDISDDFDSTPFAFYEGGFQTNEHQWSEELQLSGEAGPAKWLLGAFYYDEHNEHLNRISLGGNNGCLPFPAATGGFPYPVCDFAGGQAYATPGLDRALVNNQFFTLDVKARALFGETTIKIADQWSTTIGLRWTKETKNQDYDFWIVNGLASLGPAGGVANLAGLPPAGVLVSPGNPEGRLYTLSPNSRAPGGPPQTAYSADWSQVTPKFGLEWKPAENLLYYFSYSKGFKSGGFNGRPSPNAQGVFGIAAYNPEKIDSFELGAKTQFADNRVRLNVALFQSNYKGIQLLAVDAASGFFNTLNAAESRIRGVEAELQVRPVPALQLQAGLGYQKDEYRSLDASVQAAGIEYGMHLPLTPKLNGSLGAQYTWNIGPGNFTLHGDYSFRSESWFEAANTALNRQGGYGLLNARATYEFDEGGHWSVAAYGLNLANKFYRTNVQDVIAAGLGIAFAAVSPPREWGGEVRYRFGR